MKNIIKLLAGFALGGLTAVMVDIAPLMVPALLAVMAAAIIIDSVSDNQSKSN